MTKKTNVKVRMVPESKPDSPFYYYLKKPAGGEKAKIKLKARKYNPASRKHEIFVWPVSIHVADAVTQHLPPRPPPAPH